MGLRFWMNMAQFLQTILRVLPISWFCAVNNLSHRNRCNLVWPMHYGRTLSIVASIRTIFSTRTTVRRLSSTGIVVWTIAFAGTIGFLLAPTTLLISIPSWPAFRLAPRLHLARFLTRFWNCTNKVERVSRMHWNLFANKLLNPNKITTFSIVAESVSNSTSTCPCCAANPVNITFRFIG